jgi:hypothetical protein
MHPPHPYLCDQLVQARHQDLVRTAAAHAAPRATRSCAPTLVAPYRQRIGWAFIEIGLGLAVSRKPAVTH